MRKPPDGAKMAAEAKTFLDANPDINHIAMIFTDLCGVARGKSGGGCASGTGDEQQPRDGSRGDAIRDPLGVCFH